MSVGLELLYFVCLCVCIEVYFECMYVGLSHLNRRPSLVFLASPLACPRLLTNASSRHSFNSVINALGMAGLWKEALSVMEDMVMDGVAPNSVTYASAINACGNSRQLGRALGLLKEARLAGIEVFLHALHMYRDLH